jgi:hypothetical protein
MSISSVTNINSTGLVPSASSNSVVSNSGIGSASNSAGSSSASQASSIVTLSAGAQVIADFNAQGVSVETVALPTLTDGESVFQAVQEQAAAHPTGDLTEADFASVAAEYGETAKQADQLFAALDANGSGSLTNQQVLGALSQTGSDPGAATSQELIAMMNGGGPDAVTADQYMAFETALIDAETPAAGSNAA